MGVTAAASILLAVPLIAATIAIPSLLRSRQAANEAGAVANLRTINTAEVVYLSGSGGFYGSLPDLITEGLIDPRFAQAVGGYSFSVTLSESNSEYLAVASPSSENAGRFGYYSGPDGVVRYYGGDNDGIPVQ